MSNETKNWMRLGFHYGQLEDILYPPYISGHRNEADELIVKPLLIKLQLSVHSCLLDSQIRRDTIAPLFADMGEIWEQRFELDREYSEKKFELLLQNLLHAKSIVFSLELEKHIHNWLRIGILLGKSSGYWDCETDDTSEFCWAYRDLGELEKRLNNSGISLQAVSGIPALLTKSDIKKFCAERVQKEPRNPLTKIYPIHRWGWAFIEQQLLPDEDCEIVGSTSTTDRITDGNPETGATGCGGQDAPDELIPGYLDLIPWEETKQVKRKGYDKTVDLTASRLWGLFMLYFKSREVYLTKNTIEENWEKITGKKVERKSNVVNTANTDLRKKLSDIGITVAPKKDEKDKTLPEWRLESIRIPEDQVDE